MTPLSAQDRLTRAEERALQMTTDEVLRQIEIKGQADELEPSIWVSTEPFLKRSSNNDRFLRANIDKISGHIFYQLYLRTASSSRVDFNRMTFLVSGQLQSASAQRVYFDVSCYRSSCTHYQDFVVDLERDQLEALVRDGDEPFWKARLFGGYVEGVDIMVLKNETSALLATVDRLSIVPAEE